MGWITSFGSRLWLGPDILGMAASSGGLGSAAGPDPVDRVDFVTIGIAIEAPPWAFLGGWAARYFASGSATTTTKSQSR